MRLVLGLEIHLHLKTDTKMFCYCDADIYGAEPNTHTCPVCLGLPGALPVPNADAVRKAQLLGLALGSTLNKNSRFDRKHYHYPDLAKGYQISQYLQPLCMGGGSGLIERIHLEEDVGKSIHQGGKTLIDFNKSGIPLVEIVTKPIFKTVGEAVEFSKKIQGIVRALGIGDADMEKGQMRLEANISLADEKSAGLPNYKVEIKNINSFKFMEKAVLAEIARQEELFKSGTPPIQENRGYDEDKNITVSQREKEFAHDYRYFPEPDIPPMEFSDEYFDKLRNELPDLPDQVKAGLMEKYKLNEKNATAILGNKDSLNQFKQIIASKDLDSNKVVNLIINRKDYSGLSAEDFIKKLNSESDYVSDEEKLNEVAQEFISENPDAVKNYKGGNQGSFQFLVGQAMKKTAGKADPEVTAKLLKKLIEVA